MPSRSDTDALLEQLFELPPAQWPEQLDVLCREYPQHAEHLRRRHDLLAATGLDAPPAPAPLRDVPERFGDYRLVRRLGQGGMGMVFVAEQCSLGRLVAIKFVRPELSFSPFARERFRREIDAIAQLDHPGIVPILAHDQTGDVPYYVMPLVHGASGEDVVQHLRGNDATRLTGGDLRRALSRASADAAGDDPAGVFEGSWWQACVRLVRQAALALHHAHRHGIVHRDVKPSNLLFTADGRTLVVDFGLAHVSDDARITRSGAAPGSPAYMSPEQLRGGATDVRTDVYSLAISLHHLLALRHPLPIDDSDALRAAILSGRREALPSGAMPPELAIVLGAAMDLDPERRHATADAFAADLLAVLEQRPIVARALPRRLRMRRWMQRHPTTTTALLLGGLLLTATPTLVALGVAGERDRALNAEAAASRNAYEANIAAASGALRAGDRAEAERRLAACPESLRGFEWRHLRQALTGSLREFTGHTGAVTAVAIRPDASWMASADVDGGVLVWRPLQDAIGTRVESLDRLPIEALAIRDDGGRVTVVQSAVAAVDAGQARRGPSIRVFDTNTGAALAERLSTTLGERVCVASGGDALLLVDGYLATELDAFTLQPLRSVVLAPVGPVPAGPIAFDGEWLFASTLRSVCAWHLVDGRAGVLHDALPLGAASAAAAERRGSAVFATRDGDLVTVDVEPLRARRIDSVARGFDRAAMDASGAFVVGIGADHAFRAWSTATGRATCQAFGRPAVGRAVAVASRRLLAVVGDAGGSLTLHGMFGTNERQLLVGHSGIVSGVAATRTGALLSASHEPALRAWDPARGAPCAASYSLRHWANALAVAPDGQRVFASYRSTIVRLTLPDLKPDGEVDAGGWVFHLFPLPDGDVVAVLWDRVERVDVGARRVLASVPRERSLPLAACAIADTCAMIATPQHIERWQLTSGLRLLGTLPVPHASAIVCSRDGMSLFTSEAFVSHDGAGEPRRGVWLRRRGSDDGALQWERSCAHAVTSLLLLPDESRLVTGHDDGSVGLWQTDDCVRVATLRAGEVGVRALAADSGGRWLAVGDERATVTLFRAGGADEPFAIRLARADTTAASWLDDRLRADLKTRPAALDAIAGQVQLDPVLGEGMLQAERLRPDLTWEDLATTLSFVIEPLQPDATYELGLQLANFALEQKVELGLARQLAAFASLRLGRFEDALRHCDLGLDVMSGGLRASLVRAARAMALWQLGRRAEARAGLAALEAGLAEPVDAELSRVLAEARRLVTR